MSRFYIGQRVRVARNVGLRLLDRVVGMEGVVAALGLPGRNGHSIGLHGYRGLLFHPDDLEPVLPPGLESLAEINALFEPSPEVASACPQS